MKQTIKQTIILLVLVILLSLPFFVFAQNAAMDRLKDVGPKSGYNAQTSEKSVAQISGTAIKAFLSLLGVIFIILMVLAGYNWMTAAGDEQKVEKAKETIKRAIIGLVIVLGAFAITQFVLLKILFG
jgi:amino acid transporter